MTVESWLFILADAPLLCWRSPFLSTCETSVLHSVVPAKQQTGAMRFTLIYIVEYISNGPKQFCIDFEAL